MENLATETEPIPIEQTSPRVPRSVTTAGCPMESDPQSIVLAAECALHSGDPREARRLLELAATLPPFDEAKTRLTEVDSWTDAWLVAAIRCNPPDTEALDELARRHWKSLFGRCQMLAANREEAGDLAQEAWCRLLRARASLKPDGNFPGYLHTIAMNLWRDRCRAERRAGAMAGNQLVSLDAKSPNAEGELCSFGDVVPDLASLDANERATVMKDVDQALAELTPALRGVLVARYLMNESCAEIGRRHGRTEQTVSGWIRQGIHEMKTYLLESRRETPPPIQS